MAPDVDRYQRQQAARAPVPRRFRFSRLAFFCEKRRCSMECIDGKNSLRIDRAELDRRLDGFHAVHMDIGTGDGRFALALARRFPHMFVIGLDACRDPLRQAARRSPANLLFVAANVYALPDELAGRATRISINFPWGSLLNGLLTDDPALMAGLIGLGNAATELELFVNGDALATLGAAPLAGGEQIRRSFVGRGLAASSPVLLDKAALRTVPTTWAQRLAFGRNPQALYCRAAWASAAERVAQRQLALSYGA
jgi:hypothetical protein